MAKAKKRILIAEDSVHVRELLIKALQLNGYDSMTAEDGLEAIEKIQAGGMDLVLLDITMPKLDGLEALARIKTINPSLPVVLISVLKDPDSMREAMKHNVVAYFQKPFNIHELIGSLNKILSVAPTAAAVPSGPVSGKKTPRKSPVPKAALFLGGAIFLGLAAFGVLRLRKPAPGVSTDALPLQFSLPYNNPTGVAWDGQNLWTCDWTTQMIYKHKADQALTMEKFYLQSDFVPLSLAWGNGSLWSVGQDGTVRRHDPQTLAVGDTYRFADLHPSALAWDGKNLWSCDSRSNKISRHRMDSALGSEVAYPYPGKNPVGMAWIGNDLWIADEETRSVYRLAYDNDLFVVSQVYQLEPHKDGTRKLSGIALGPGSLWTVSEGSGLIFRHPLESLPGKSNPS